MITGNIMLTLLNDILDFSSLEVGKLVLHTGNCDLVRLVYDVVKIYLSILFIYLFIFLF